MGSDWNALIGQMSRTQGGFHSGYINENSEAVFEVGYLEVTFFPFILLTVTSEHPRHQLPIASWKYKTVQAFIIVELQV